MQGVRAAVGRALFAGAAVALLVCGARSSTGAPAPQRVERSLLDGPVRITASARSRSRVRTLKRDHWRLDAYRHAGLQGADAPFERLVTFRRDHLARYLRGEPEPPRALQGPVHLRLGKPQPWPRNRGVFELRRSLLLPAGATAEAKRRVPPGGALRFELGLVPLRHGRAPLQLTIRLRAAVGRLPVILDERRVGAREAGRWQTVRLSLLPWAGREVDLEISVTRAGRGKAVGVVALGQPVLEGVSRQHKPNLLVIIMDTVRRDALGCYGQRRVLTPHVDEFARQGARFAHAFTVAPWTRPSLMALLSSRTPNLAGARPARFAVPRAYRRWIRELGPPTLFSHLSHLGYRVKGVLNNFFMLPHERVGMDHGLADMDHIQWGEGRKRRDNEAITAAATRFLRAERNGRFFLYVIYESVHAPYDPPKRWQARLRRHLGLPPHRRLHSMDLYRAEVMRVDHHVGRLLSALHTLGLEKNTLVVVTADHGEILQRHHCYTIPRPGKPSTTCFSHSASLYGQTLRVPLLMRGPGVAARRRVDQVTRHLDVVPTILGRLGLPALPGAQGVDLSAYLQPGPPPQTVPRDVYAAARWSWALRRGDWKIILRERGVRTVYRRGKRLKLEQELYNCRTDPDERHNLAGRQWRRARRLARALRRLARADRVAPPAGWPRGLRRRLRPPLP